MFPEHPEQFDRAPDLMELESALRSLVPRESAIERDALMFRAGQASIARPVFQAARWRWPLATAAAALVALVVGRVTTQISEPRVIERVVAVRVPVVPAESTTDGHVAAAADDRAARRAAEFNLPADYQRSFAAR